MVICLLLKHVLLLVADFLDLSFDVLITGYSDALRIDDHRTGVEPLFWIVIEVELVQPHVEWLDEVMYLSRLVHDNGYLLLVECLADLSLHD
jgi:hypothetical protein